MKSLAQHWETIQGSLFPTLEEHLPPLTEKQQQLVSILEFVRIEQFIQSYIPGFRGRPSVNRTAIARAFVAKAVYNMPTTTILIERLHSDISMRRICGWETRSAIPSESVFSRAFAEFAETGLADRVHASLIKQVYKDEIVGHAVTDATSIEAREKPVKQEKIVEIVKTKKVRAKKGEPTVKDMTRIERQFRGDMSLKEMIEELPKVCDAVAKKNSKGNLCWWVGYKLHFTTDDHGVPLAAITSSASLHDSQVAIPLAQLTAQRVINFYDLMDGGYYSDRIIEHSKSLGHVPIIDQPVKGVDKEEKALENLAYATLNWRPPHLVRYDSRTTVERAFSRLKDEFGATFVRVRGGLKVTAHLMFGVLALAADQLLKIVSS